MKSETFCILSYWSPNSLYCKLCPNGYYSGYPLSSTTIQGAYNTLTSKCYFVSTTATAVTYTSAVTTCTTAQTGPASGTAPIYESNGIYKYIRFNLKMNDFLFMVKTISFLFDGYSYHV